VKKAIFISIILIFLLTNIGLKFVISYCPVKETYSVSFEEYKSCCCDDAKDNDCCKSEKYSLNKIEDKYISSGLSLSSLQSDFLVTEFPAVIFAPIKITRVKFYKKLKPPALRASLNILFRSLLI
jgi:hypothetical protein